MVHVVSETSPSSLVGRSRAPKGGPARETRSVKSSRQAAVESPSFCFPDPLCTEAKQKNADLFFKHVYPRVRVAGGRRGWEGPGPWAHPTAHPGVGPRPPGHCARPLRLNPLSVRPEMLWGGRPAWHPQCQASFDSLYLPLSFRTRHDAPARQGPGTDAPRSQGRRGLPLSF